jgi:hypothetical protein
MPCGLCFFFFFFEAGSCYICYVAQAELKLTILQPMWLLKGLCSAMCEWNSQYRRGMHSMWPPHTQGSHRDNQSTMKSTCAQRTLPLPDSMSALRELLMLWMWIWLAQAPSIKVHTGPTQPQVNRNQRSLQKNRLVWELQISPVGANFLVSGPSLTSYVTFCKLCDFLLCVLLVPLKIERMLAKWVIIKELNGTQHHFFLQRIS